MAGFEMAVLVGDAVVAGARVDKDARYVVAFPGALCREHLLRKIVWKIRACVVAFEVLFQEVVSGFFLMEKMLKPL